MNELLCVYSAAINATCSRVCGDYGCWGPGEDQCVRCPNYRHNVTRVCLESCVEEPRLYADDSAPQKQCQPCDPQCLNSCTGPVITILCGRLYVTVTLDVIHGHFRHTPRICNLILLLNYINLALTALYRSKIPLRLIKIRRSK